MYWGLDPISAVRVRRTLGVIFRSRYRPRRHIRQSKRPWLPDQSSSQVSLRSRSTLLDCCVSRRRKRWPEFDRQFYTIHNEMWKKAPELARALYGPIARTGVMRSHRDVARGTNFLSSIITKADFAINYLRTHIDMSDRHPDALRRSEQVDAALDLVHELAMTPLCIFRCRSSRVTYSCCTITKLARPYRHEDWPEQDRKRYLLRLWLLASGWDRSAQGLAGATTA